MALTHHQEQEAGATRFDHYDFIGISAEIFKETKDLLRAQTNHIPLGLLDVEADPIEQGFEAETYNFIIASKLFTLSNILTSLLQIQESCCSSGKSSSYLK